MHRVPHARRRGGSMLIYSLVLMTLMLGILSLAVDYGRLQMIKTQLQRDADATARGSLNMYVYDGTATLNTCSPWMATNDWNPVDANSGVAQSVSITWGWWSAATHAFVAGSGSPLAVQVVVSRTAANGNAVPLIFPLLNGGGSAVRTTCDVSAKAVAVLTPATTVTPTVPGSADVWLAGMPSGSTASYNDTAANAAPTLAMSVTPGSIITFNATGSTSNTSGSPYIPADGVPSNTVSHMQGSPDGNTNGCQNGIQTVTAPLGSLLGVFLTSSAPNTQTPPAAGLNYSSTASKNAASYVAIKNQQPFFVGNGQTASSQSQSFLVPKGATRLYLGTLDEYENYNNTGSLVVSVTQQARVTLMQ